jgi:hypothetical protein
MFKGAHVLQTILLNLNGSLVVVLVEIVVNNIAMIPWVIFQHFRIERYNPAGHPSYKRIMFYDGKPRDLNTLQRSGAETFLAIAQVQ